MKSCVLILLLLGVLGLKSCAGLNDASRIAIKEITVKLENATARYPDSLVLLSPDFPEARRQQLFRQLGHEVRDNQVPEDEEDERDDVTEAVVTVLRAADVLLKAASSTNTSEDAPAAVVGVREPPFMQVYLMDSTEQGRYGRKRRALRRSPPLVRVRRAYTKPWQDSCHSCQALVPQQPLVINIVTSGSDCGGNCAPPYNKQPPCGHPECGPSHFPPHHPMFYPHPPPPPPPMFHLHHPPPPPFHHPPQPVYHFSPPQPAYHPPPVYPSTSPPTQPAYRPPQQPARQQPPQQSAPSVNSCDPCAPRAPQGGSALLAGSFSHSSASAQSSSFAWNGKK